MTSFVTMQDLYDAVRALSPEDPAEQKDDPDTALFEFLMEGSFREEAWDRYSARTGLDERAYIDACEKAFAPVIFPWMRKNTDRRTYPVLDFGSGGAEVFEQDGKFCVATMFLRLTAESADTGQENIRGMLISAVRDLYTRTHAPFCSVETARSFLGWNMGDIPGFRAIGDGGIRFLTDGRGKITDIIYEDEDLGMNLVDPIFATY